jgi:hypothetical protein
LWVLTLNASPTGGVELHLPDGPVDMIQVGGTWKYASEYYSYESLVGLPVTATFYDATGAFLTDQIPRFNFDLARIGDDDACPIAVAGVCDDEVPVLAPVGDAAAHLASCHLRTGAHRHLDPRGPTAR